MHRISRFPISCLAEGIKPEEIEFGELGYAREARASYQDFCAARECGELPPHVKFQVCLPTPMAVIYAYCCERDVIAVYEAYEHDMVREVKAVCDAIPHQDLCIQWGRLSRNAHLGRTAARHVSKDRHVARGHSPPHAADL